LQLVVAFPSRQATSHELAHHNTYGEEDEANRLRSIVEAYRAMMG
jgi:hypothetical protein